MEVRPRVASGLLVHVPSEHGHFSVLIRGGEVRLSLFSTLPCSGSGSDKELLTPLMGDVIIFKFNMKKHFGGWDLYCYIYTSWLIFYNNWYRCFIMQ